MKKTLLVILVLNSILLAKNSPVTLPVQTPVQDAVDDIQLLEGRVLRQKLYEEQYQKQLENAKKRQEELKKQEERKKQKRIDANEEARKQNEAYYKSQQTEITDDNVGIIKIKRTPISDINKSH